MEGCDVVFHTAGYVRVWSRDPEIYYLENVVGTENILSCAMKEGIKKVIVTSTGSIFSSSNEITTEESLRSSAFSTHYEASKMLAEERVKTYALRGLNVCIVNPTRVYGPGSLGRSNGPTRMIINYLNGPVGLVPQQHNSLGSYAFIDDVVNGHVFAMHRAQAGERYILGGENISINRFFDIVDGVLGTRKVRVAVPPEF